MNPNNPFFERNKTMDISSKTDNKVFIKIPLETGGFWQKEYLQNDLIETVVNDFKNENHVDIPQDYFEDWNFKNKSLKMTDKIKTLLNQEIPTVCINQVIKKKPLFLTNEDIIPDLVGKPFNDPFEVFLFVKEDKSLKIQTYDPETINKLNLNNYSPSSAYCNGNNHLFISGGKKKNGEIIDDFWEIDLKDQNIAEPVKIPQKKNHSMIFIPKNYIFIVGGNDKKTFYFNTENAEVCQWADLNKIRIEPALQRIGNNLYCFDNINKGNNDIFSLEKTDLNSNKPEWTLLTPKFNLPINDEQKLSQKFFGVSKDDEDNIIFLGGNMDNYSDNSEIFNYKYNTNFNTIELSKVPYRRYNFKEKTFLTYKKNIDYILPDFNKQHPEVVFFVKKNNKMEAIDYEPKMNSQLKSLKPPMGDFKYDFNMPIVAIPDPVNEFNLDLQNQNNTEQQNIPTSNIKMNINEPSFQDYNFKNHLENNDIKTDYKNKMEMQTNFKEPEIEPTKEDIKLSMEINKDIFQIKDQINLKNKNDNYLINNDTNIQNEPLNKNIAFNDNGINPKISLYNNQGNELDAMEQGKNKTFSIPGKNEINMPQEHQKNHNIELNEIINPEYKMNGNIIEVDANVPKIEGPDDNLIIKGNKNIESSISGLIPGTGPQQIDNKPLNNLKINYMNNVDLKGTIPGIKSLNKHKIKTNDNKKMEGIIPGVKNPQTTFNMQYPNAHISPNAQLGLKGPNINKQNDTINNNIGEININEPKISINNPNVNLKQNTNISSNNIKMPNYNMYGNIPGKVNHKNIGVNLNNQINKNINKDVPDVNLDNPKIDMPSSKIELDMSKQKMPDYNISGNIPGVKNSQITMNNRFKNTTFNQDINVSGCIQGNSSSQLKSPPNINNSRKIPDYNLYGNIPGKGAKNPSNNVKKNQPKEIIFAKGIIPGKKKIVQNNQIPKEQKNLEKKVNVPNLNISGNIPNINANAPNVNLNPGTINIMQEQKINVPNYSMSGNIPGVKVEEPKINVPNYNITGNIPGVKIEEQKINLNEPKLKSIQLNGPKIETNNIKMNENIQNYEPLKISLPNVEENSSKIELKGPQLNIKGNEGQNEMNIPKIQMPNVNSNINLNDIKINDPNIPNHNISGIINGNLNNKQMKNINISGVIPGKKKVQSKNQNSNISPEVAQIINVPKEDLKTENIEINPLTAEFEQGNSNINPQKVKKPFDYNISGNIPGVKVTKLSTNHQKPKEFYVQGLIPSSQNITNTNYKINSPDVQLPAYQTYSNLNDSIRFSKKQFHGSINDPNNFDSYNNIKGSRNMVILNPSINNYSNNPNVPLIKSKNIENKPNNVNLVASKLEITPEKNLNLSNSQNIMQKSNNEYYPAENSDIYNSYNINNNRNSNLQRSNIDYKIDNNIINSIDNKPQLQKNNNQDQYIINGEDINVEIPKIDVKLKNNITEMTKVEPQYKNNNNNIKDRGNYKLTDLRFRTINEEMSNMNSGNIAGENIYSGSNRGNSKKKNNELPLVGTKSNTFKSSKIGVAGELYTENIDINNLKSANVGVNGIKIGDRIID